MSAAAYGPVTLDGFHAVKHALRFAPELVGEVTVADLAAVRALASRLAPDILAGLLARAVQGPVGHHTGVQAVAARPVPDTGVLIRRSAPLVLLDRPRHAGNAGAVIRVAAAVGASGVAVAGGIDPWAPAVLRGSAGLHYALPVLSVRELEVAGPMVVLDAEGDCEVELPPDGVLVVGSERDGVCPSLLARADSVLALPMRPGVSSLNLATAVAAVLYGQRWHRWPQDRPAREV